MVRAFPLTTLSLGVLLGLIGSDAEAATSLSLPPTGGDEALAVTVDVATRRVRYAACKAEPCAVTTASPFVAITVPSGDEGLVLEAKRVSLEDVVLVGGKHLAHVKVLLGADAEPEAVAWEALFVAGAPPLFAGLTGWSRGEPGERSGTDVRFIRDAAGVVVVIGDVREDLRICGDDATLLEPRGLDPRTVIFHGATLQRLPASRRDAALSIEATAHHGHADASLTPLLTATEASSSLGTAANLTDGDPSTSWSEGRPGRGQGEFVLMRAPFDVPITRFSVTVAPLSAKPAANEGVAPETFYLATNAATYEIALPDDAWSHPGEAYDIALPAPLQTSCVALVLADAFTRGKAHPDVTVAELVAYSAFDHAGATLAEVATALSGGDARATAAAALLERAGASGVAAMAASYTKLNASGRALAINVAASDSNCMASARLLTAALSDQDDVVRSKAESKLHEPSCSREALPALEDALKDPTSRPKVAPLVAFVGRESALGPLGEVLGDGPAVERSVLRAAAGYAARRAAPADLGLLLTNASKRSPLATVDALRAISERLGDAREAADASVAALFGAAPSLDVRYALVDVVAGLALASDVAEQDRLADLVLRDPAREIRAFAAERLGATRTPEAVATAALQDAEPRVREGALHAVALSPIAAVSPAIASLLARDPWTFVRVAAAEALARSPTSTETDRALADALTQLSPRVREQSTVALATRGAIGYRETIRGRFVDAKEDPAVRAASARAVGALCDAHAADALTEAVVLGASSLDPNEVSLGLVATEALGALHPKDLAARFAPLKSKIARPAARAAAARALEAKPHCP
jgi:hypothetical protein